MDYKVEYAKLLKKVEDAGGGKFIGKYQTNPGFQTKETPWYIPKLQPDTIKLYRKKYVTTKQYNKKTKKFEWFDQRTEDFYDAKETKEHIFSENEKQLKKYYLETFGTETPQKDLKYLQQGINLQKYKNRKNLSIERSSSWLHGIRYLGSRKVEGSDQKVFDAEHNKEIDRRNQLLIKSKEGTSYERKDNAELEYKINQSVKNKEEQPINLKDVSATSSYVDMRRKQLEIDKQFNTTRDGVVY